MFIPMPFRLPCWPLKPVLVAGALIMVLAAAGIIFSVVMLIDCLKRPREGFHSPITKDAEYDKLIWAAAIVVSLWFYFIGAIVYFFVVFKAKPKNRGDQ